MRSGKPSRRRLVFDSLERRETPATTTHVIGLPRVPADVARPTVTHNVTVPLAGAGQSFLISSVPVPGQGYSNTLANLAGRASQILTFTGQIKGALNSFGVFTSTGTLTLENGDVLAVAVGGTSLKSQGKPLQFKGNFFVSGFAGTYNGARGSGTVVGHFNPALNTAYYRLHGTITLVVPGSASR